MPPEAFSMPTFFAIVAFVFGLVALVSGSPAGVGFACLVAILALMAQGEAQHAQLLAAVTREQAKPLWTPPPPPEPPVTPANVDEVAKRLGVSERT
jgi:flagellar biosynthesis component FlhA